MLGILFAISCTTMDLDKPLFFEGHEDFNGMNKESATASPNPKIVIETRCFKRFKTDGEFVSLIIKKWPGKEIKFKMANNPRIGFWGEHVFCAVIYLGEEKEK